MTPDPAGMAAADPANPQSWNRYAYVMNNPLNATDPLGLQSASQNDQCSPNSGAPVGDGNPTEPGLECGTGAIDASDPHPPHIDTPSVYVYAPPLSAVEIMKADEAIFQWFVDQTKRTVKKLTFGVRAPGQSWSQCMSTNANTYSFGGSLELGVNVATGTSTNFSEKTSAVTGNQITGLIFEGPGAGDFVSAASHGAGSPFTFGRRTSDIMSLNLAGKGGLPQALESAGAKGLFETAGKWLNLGMDEAEKGAVDAGLAGAESLNCAIPR